jgi:hypothetical protein
MWEATKLRPLQYLDFVIFSGLKLQAIDVTTLNLAINDDPNLQISVNGTNRIPPVSVPMPPAGTDLSIVPSHPSYHSYSKEYVVRGSTTAAILMSPILVNHKFLHNFEISFDPFFI